MRGGHKKGYRVSISNIGRDATVVRPFELRRIKEEYEYYPPTQKKAKVEHDELIRQKSKEKKETQREDIYKADATKNQQKQQNVQSTQSEKRHQILAAAQAKKNEELDEVKTMNSNMLEARVLAIRDRQLQLKREQQQREKEDDDRLNQMLEEGRQKALKLYAEREQFRLEQRSKGKKMLEAQIKEKKDQKILDVKRREEERKMMLEANRRQLEEEKKLALARKQKQQAFDKDLELFMSQRRQYKKEMQEKEYEEDKILAAYQAEKNRKQDEYEKKVLEAKLLKEKEIDPIRKQQQKHIDDRAAKDEAIAQRIQNEQEQREREREVEEAKKKANERKLLTSEYENMRKVREDRALELAKLDKQQWEADMAVVKAAREKERAEKRKKFERNSQYQNDLKKVIEQNHEKKRLQILEGLDEQRTIKEQQEDYLNKLEQIRQMKIDQLRQEGVPEKYINSCMNQRINVK